MLGLDIPGILSFPVWSKNSHNTLKALALVLHCYSLRLAKKISRQFLDQSEAKPKPMVTCLHAFSPRLAPVHVFDSSSDWFIGLFTTDVIGQSNYFGFGFTALN